MRAKTLFTLARPWPWLGRHDKNAQMTTRV